MKLLVSAALLLATLPGAAVAAQPARMDAQHQMLARLAGQWSVRQTIWTTGEAQPEVDTGTADFAMVLKQRHLRQTLRVADGTGFEDLATLATTMSRATFSALGWT